MSDTRQITLQEEPKSYLDLFAAAIELRMADLLKQTPGNIQASQNEQGARIFEHTKIQTTSNITTAAVSSRGTELPDTLKLLIKKNPVENNAIFNLIHQSPYQEHEPRETCVHHDYTYIANFLGAIINLIKNDLPCLLEKAKIAVENDSELNWSTERSKCIKHIAELYLQQIPPFIAYYYDPKPQHEKDCLDHYQFLERVANPLQKFIDESIPTEDNAEKADKEAIEYFYQSALTIAHLHVSPPITTTEKEQQNNYILTPLKQKKEIYNSQSALTTWSDLPVRSAPVTLDLSKLIPTQTDLLVIATNPKEKKQKFSELIYKLFVEEVGRLTPPTVEAISRKYADAFGQEFTSETILATLGPEQKDKLQTTAKTIALANREYYYNKYPNMFTVTNGSSSKTGFESLHIKKGAGYFRILSQSFEAKAYTQIINNNLPAVAIMQMYRTLFENPRTTRGYTAWGSDQNKGYTEVAKAFYTIANDTALDATTKYSKLCEHIEKNPNTKKWIEEIFEKNRKNIEKKFGNSETRKTVINEVNKLLSCRATEAHIITRLYNQAHVDRIFIGPKITAILDNLESRLKNCESINTELELIAQEILKIVFDDAEKLFNDQDYQDAFSSITQGTDYKYQDLLLQLPTAYIQDLNNVYGSGNDAVSAAANKIFANISIYEQALKDKKPLNITDAQSKLSDVLKNTLIDPSDKKLFEARAQVLPQNPKKITEKNKDAYYVDRKTLLNNMVKFSRGLSVTAIYSTMQQIAMFNGVLNWKNLELTKNQITVFKEKIKHTLQNDAQDQNGTQKEKEIALELYLKAIPKAEINLNLTCGRTANETEDWHTLSSEDLKKIQALHILDNASSKQEITPIETKEILAFLHIKKLVALPSYIIKAVDSEIKAFKNNINHHLKNFTLSDFNTEVQKGKILLAASDNNHEALIKEAQEHSGKITSNDKNKPAWEDSNITEQQVLDYLTTQIDNKNDGKSNTHSNAKIAFRHIAENTSYSIRERIDLIACVAWQKYNMTIFGPESIAQLKFLHRSAEDAEFYSHLALFRGSADKDDNYLKNNCLVDFYMAQAGLSETARGNITSKIGKLISDNKIIEAESGADVEQDNLPAEVAVEAAAEANLENIASTPEQLETALKTARLTQGADNNKSKAKKKKKLKLGNIDSLITIVDSCVIENDSESQALIDGALDRLSAKNIDPAVDFTKVKDLISSLAKKASQEKLTELANKKENFGWNKFPLHDKDYEAITINASLKELRARDAQQAERDARQVKLENVQQAEQNTHLPINTQLTIIQKCISRHLFQHPEQNSSLARFVVQLQEMAQTDPLHINTLKEIGTQAKAKNVLPQIFSKIRRNPQRQEIFKSLSQLADLDSNADLETQFSIISKVSTQIASTERELKTGEDKSLDAYLDHARILSKERGLGNEKELEKLSVDSLVLAKQVIHGKKWRASNPPEKTSGLITDRLKHMVKHGRTINLDNFNSFGELNKLEGLSTKSAYSDYIDACLKQAVTLKKEKILDDDNAKELSDVVCQVVFNITHPTISKELKSKLLKVIPQAVADAAKENTASAEPEAAPNAVLNKISNLKVISGFIKLAIDKPSESNLNEVIKIVDMLLIKPADSSLINTKMAINLLKKFDKFPDDSNMKKKIIKLFAKHDSLFLIALEYYAERRDCVGITKQLINAYAQHPSPAPADASTNTGLDQPVESVESNTQQDNKKEILNYFTLPPSNASSSFNFFTPKPEHDFQHSNGIKAMKNATEKLPDNIYFKANQAIAKGRLKIHSTISARQANNIYSELAKPGATAANFQTNIISKPILNYVSRNTSAPGKTQ